MLRFVIRRLVWAIPTLLLVTFLVFVAIRIGCKTTGKATWILTTFRYRCNFFFLLLGR